MKNLLLLYFIISAFVSSAKNPKIDSLQQVLKDFDAKKLELHKNFLPDESDTTKVNILLKLTWELLGVSDYVVAKKYCDEALAIAQQIGYKKGISDSYYSVGAIGYSQGNYKEALKNYFAALKLREEAGDEKGMASCYNNIGLNYWQLGNNPEALKNYFTSLKVWEEIGDKNHMADAYNNIGLIYADQSNYPEALKNYFASLKIKEEIGNNNGIGNSYNNIGIIYFLQGKYPEALKSYFISLKTNEETGDRYAVANNYYNIGNVYNKQDNYPDALKNYFTSLEISEKIGDKNGMSMCYNGIGATKLKMQAPAEGKNWLQKGLQLAKEIEATPLMKESYEGLARADSALGNYKGAYENHKLFILYRDSLDNEELTRKSLQTKMQYEFDRKEAETKMLTDAELKKQKILRNGFVGGFAVVLLFALVFFRQRNKTKKEKLRSDTLLLNILPVEVADEIKTSGTAKAKSFTMVTVMFADIKDFTTVSEKISAELLVDEINTCFSAFDNIIDKYRIEKIKTIGDAYLCASGLPVSNYTHAVDMLNAAFEIRSYILERKKRKKS